MYHQNESQCSQKHHVSTNLEDEYTNSTAQTHIARKKTQVCATMESKQSGPDSLADVETPTTPTDAMNVSGSDDEMLILNFNCKVIMMSGRVLGPFECNERSTVAWIRFRIQKELEDLCNKGELDCVDFHLIRPGSNKCVSNDDIKIYELVEIADAVLDIVPDRQ